MKDVNIKVEFNQKRICNNVVITGGFMKLDENAIKIAVQKGPHQITPRTFTVWQALCVTYFKEEDASITKNLALSTKYISDTFGFNKRSVQDAIVELIEKGWLINVKDELYALTVPQNEECANCSQGVCTNHSQGVCTNHSQGVCTNHSQGYEQNAHRGMSETLTQSIIKVEEEVDSIYALDAAKEIEEELEVVEVQPAATTIEDAASEDAAASSGYDYIKQWESDANKYKDLLRPIQESGALKKFVKGTITPWHYDKSKTEQDYYDKLTALSLWNRVTHNSDFNMENDNNSKHPCFSLKRTYELWNQAEIFTPKD